MVRHSPAVEYRGADTVEARLMSGSHVIKPAYPSLSFIKTLAEAWKITYSIYAITGAPADSHTMISVTAPESDTVPMANRLSGPIAPRPTVGPAV